MIRAILLLLLLCIGLAAYATFELKARWEQPLAVPASGYYLQVGAGESFQSVARRLKQEGVYADDWLLRLQARRTGVDQEIKRGEYLIPAQTTPAALFAMLTLGDVIRYQVTLPEGITLRRALQILHETPALEAELKDVTDPRIAALVAPQESSEGLFFPDTYQFERGATDWTILQRAYAAMARILAEEWAQRADALPYASPYQALIMASIVERETGMPHERGEIAGVFVRRLQRDMRLQTDPTVIYGLGENFDGDLRRVHLRDQGNPYNTYRHKGLPPTPIALPGRAAIHAALHPEPGSTLFFVARGDGGHYFSDTLAEHQKAVRKYQLQRRSDYRSTPGN